VRLLIKLLRAKGRPVETHKSARIRSKSIGLQANLVVAGVTGVSGAGFVGVLAVTRS
jgi:hypothetical protein